MTLRLAEEIGAGQASRARPTWGYYRQPNGWITTSPMTDIENLKYRREGWEALEQYGLVEMTDEYMVNHPLEPLFIRGGARELPIDQVIQMGFHLKAPLIPTCRRVIDQFHKVHSPTCWANAQAITFPQLTEVPDPFPCRFCERVLPTEPGRMRHETVAHKTERSEIRSGEVMAESMIRGLKGVMGPRADPEEPVVPADAELAELRAGLATLERELAAVKAQRTRKRRTGVS